MRLVGVSSRAALQQLCREQVETALKQGLEGRQRHWTESIAVGSPQYLNALERQLGIRAKGRDRLRVDGGYQLREAETAYQSLIGTEKRALSLENTFFWNRSLHVATG